MAIARVVWQEATDWLNQTGKITARLGDEEPIDEDNYSNMYIIVERKEDN